MLRPCWVGLTISLMRGEKNKVFGVLRTPNPTYNDLIKHILRSDKVSTLEEAALNCGKTNQHVRISLVWPNWDPETIL